MKCPKCGLEQADGRPDCQACGIIFGKWHGGGPPRHHVGEPPPLPAGPPDVYEPPPEPTGPASSARGGGVFGGVVLLAVAGLAAWWLNLSAGRSVPESAYRDPQGRFALSPPPGWMTLSSANFQQVMAEIKDRFPPAMRELMKADRVAVAFFLLGGQDQFAPSLNVVVVDRPSDVRRLGSPSGSS